MFCNQCEQSFRGVGCSNTPGVCGKDEDVQSLQEIILYGLKGMAAYANHARRLGKTDEGAQKIIRHPLLMLRFLLDEVLDLLDIRIAEEKQAMGGQTVPSGASDLLVVAFDILGQVKVDDEAHVGFVDAHAKGDGGDNDLHVVADEGFLIAVALGILQTRMIRADREAFA